MEGARAHTLWPGNAAVKLLAGYAPRDAADDLARALADAMRRRLRQPVVVETGPALLRRVTG